MRFEDTVEVKEEPLMDCEGFQDLREWCGQPQTASLNTPVYIENNFGFNFFQDTLENSNTEEHTGLCFEDWVQKGNVVDDLSSGLDIPNSNMEQQECQLNIDENAVHGIPCVEDNMTVIKNDVFVFDDSTPYEEVIEISSSSTEDVKCVDNNKSVESHSNVTFSNSLRWDLSQNFANYEPHIRNIETESPLQSPGNEVMFSTNYERSTNNFDSAPKDTIQFEYIEDHNEIDEESPDIDIEMLPIVYGKENICDISPSKVKQNNDTLIDTIILDNQAPILTNDEKPITLEVPSKAALKLKLKNCNSLWTKTNNNVMPPTCAWNEEIVVTTPDVLQTIEQLENDKKYNLMTLTYNVESYQPSETNTPVKFEDRLCEEQSYDLTPPDTPKPNSRKRRRSSQDSDASYVPEIERRSSNKKYKKNVNSKPSTFVSSVQFLESLQTPARRGRPPKRRDSVSSSGTYFDDNISVASSENKYRERREKNNEASRRSRYNRKLKDLGMSYSANELEAKNELLRIKAIELERKTKILKDALFVAMLKK